MLKGDIRPAIETHEMLYQVIKKHNFLPEVRSSCFDRVKLNSYLDLSSLSYPFGKRVGICVIRTKGSFPQHSIAIYRSACVTTAFRL